MEVKYLLIFKQIFLVTALYSLIKFSLGVSSFGVFPGMTVKKEIDNNESEHKNNTGQLTKQDIHI